MNQHDMDLLTQSCRTLLDWIAVPGLHSKDDLTRLISRAFELEHQLARRLNKVSRSVYELPEYGICEPSAHAMTLKLALTFYGFLDSDEDYGLLLDDTLFVRQQLDAWLRAERAAVSEDEAPVHPACDIPPEFRTKPMSYRDAARHLGRGNSKDAAEWVSACVRDGTLACQSMSRQLHVFDFRQFPSDTLERIKKSP